MRVTKRLKNDPDYKEAWRACRKPMDTWGPEFKPIDMRKLLAAAINDGWSPQALKAYAWTWIEGWRDHVTPAVWRWAVWRAGAKYPDNQAPKFLARFNADPDMRSRFAHLIKQSSKQALP